MRSLLTVLIFTLIFVSSLTLSANSHIGFKRGNKIEISELHGNLTAICHANWGGQLSSYYNCSGYTVNPGSHDYFVHPTMDADLVKLSVTHEDGSTKNAKSKFSAEKGASTSRFNLAVWSLTQRPLLEEGKNTINYSLEKNNKSVKNGSFVATKEVVDSRRCRTRTIYFNNENDCRDQYFACDEYFRQENNCKY